MKHLKTLAVLFAVGVAACHAGTINFGTGMGLLEGNSSFPGANVPTIPAIVYHAPLGTSVWESTQPDSTNPAIPNGTVVDFWIIFTLPGTPISGTMGVLVDDSAYGRLNGHYLYDNLGSLPGINCAASMPNCLNPLWVNITPYLLPGQNFLETVVSQDSGAQFAVDVFGTVEYSDDYPIPTMPSNQTPEPATVLLIGAGLLVVLTIGKAWKMTKGRLTRLRKRMNCRWCEEGKPEWSHYARIWIHRRATLDRRCDNPPNNYGYTIQVPEETVSSPSHQEWLRKRAIIE